jgi:hypothetical protein
MTFTMVPAIADYPCHGCGHLITQGDQHVIIDHRFGDDDPNGHYDIICLACDVRRQDKAIIEGEIVNDDDTTRALDAGSDPDRSPVPA